LNIMHDKRAVISGAGSRDLTKLCGHQRFYDWWILWKVGVSLGLQ